MVFACGVTKCSGEAFDGVPVAGSNSAVADRDPGYEACFAALGPLPVFRKPYFGLRNGAWEIHVAADQYTAAREALLRDPRCRCYAFDPD